MEIRSFIKAIKIDEDIIESAFISDALFGIWKIKWIGSMFMGLYYGLCLILLKVFNFSNKPFFVVGSFVHFAVLVFFATFLTFYLYSFIERRHLQNKRRLLKYPIFVVLNIILIAAFLYVFVDLLHGLRSSSYDFLLLLEETAIIMILPVLMFIYAFENFVVTERLKIINTVRHHQQHLKDDNIIDRPMIVKIKTDNVKETLDLNMQDFILAKSDDNYSSIVYKNNGKITKVLFRITLKKLETQFSEFDYTIRCHKSYIININHIKEVLGTSQNYRIAMQDIEYQIPVSRSFPKTAIESLKEKE